MIFTDVNMRDQNTIMAFHHLHFLVPTKVTCKKKNWTPCIPESEDGFLKVVKSSNSIAKEMEDHKIFSDLKGIGDHPIIFVVRNMGNADYFVAICRVIYKCESLIHAVNAAFQIYVMLNIPFPPQCEKVWSFINQIFYKIELQPEPNFKMVSVLNSFQF